MGEEGQSEGTNLHGALVTVYKTSKLLLLISRYHPTIIHAGLNKTTKITLQCSSCLLWDSSYVPLKYKPGMLVPKIL